jgi:DNA repair exonuclease SbcCD ATPase subunit
MIILKHITIQRFRLLREVSLRFPQRGSILIAGQNESGKSALVESIYFALYGQPLASTRLDDLILYGASDASVTLILSVGSTEITVTRTLERNNSDRERRDARQSVRLLVQKPGMPEEEAITSLSAANRRIIHELGGLDAECLRNSCLLEQKGLARLEQLPGRAREDTLRKLLGLESLLLLSSQFTVTPRDELLLHQARDRFALAQAQASIPEASARLADCEAALDAVTLLDELAEIDQQEEEATEQLLTLEHIRSTRGELKARQQRVATLRKAEATLGDIIAAYEAMAQARRDLPEFDRQLAELERREREELPALEQRVADLADLTRSFGTLERMSNDLLSSIHALKELEQEAGAYHTLQSTLASLQEQISATLQQEEQLQQQISELQEQHRAARPALEERQRRLLGLAEQQAALQQNAQRLSQQDSGRQQADLNSRQLAQLRADLAAAEQEQTRLADEIQQQEAQIADSRQQQEAQQATVRQQRARKLLEEWQRLKAQTNALNGVEQKVMAVHRQQEQFTLAAFAARRKLTTWLIGLVACVAIAIFGLAGAAAELLQQATITALVAVVLALAAAGGAYWCWQNYRKARDEKNVIEQQVQQTIKQVGGLVAERESLMRQGASIGTLNLLEQELRSLGSPVPRTGEEATAMLQQLAAPAESGGESDLAEIQKRLARQDETLTGLRNRQNQLSETISSLRQQYSRLEEQRKEQGWDNIEQRVQAERDALTQKRHQLLAALGQEGLPIPLAATQQASRSPGNDIDDASIARIIADSIAATAQEIALLDGKQQTIDELNVQLQAAREKRASLLAEQRSLEERQARFQNEAPEQQIARARQQQAALRAALQNLQDSLRERVRSLGVPFGQTAISNAEATARKQLEALHIALGGKIELESRRDAANALLKDRQDTLSEYYQQLARYSNSLGSWIIPPNPMASALTALRARCRQELEAINESAIEKEFETLTHQENAARAKIELCRHDIEQAQRRIAALLVQHNRPTPKSFTRSEIAVVWPLIEQYSRQDRNRLEAERDIRAQELRQVEQQEQQLSQQLQTGGEKLDLHSAEQLLQQQERSYQTRIYASRLIRAVDERLMHKMLPRIEYYMQQILPQLTGGRYHDVELTTEPQEGAISGGPIQLRVWETAAEQYIPKTALSGGAADQLSLALRLAFAVASLPRELAAAPGFLLLDEPLSSFDRDRARSLVDVVTGDLLDQHFEQILFISYSSAFDPAMFPYHIYMDNGLIVDSNLPAVPASVSASNGNGNSNGHVPARNGDGESGEETAKIAVPAFTGEG